jgi:hypothetical protein
MFLSSHERFAWVSDRKWNIIVFGLALNELLSPFSAMGAGFFLGRDGPAAPPSVTTTLVGFAGFAGAERVVLSPVPGGLFLQEKWEGAPEDLADLVQDQAGAHSGEVLLEQIQQGEVLEVVLLHLVCPRPWAGLGRSPHWNCDP